MFNPFNTPEPRTVRPNRPLPQVSIPVGRAYVCLSCDAIHTSSRCPACDKGPSEPLEKWLGRIKPEKKEEH